MYSSGAALVVEKTFIVYVSIFQVGPNIMDSVSDSSRKCLSIYLSCLYAKMKDLILKNSAELIVIIPPQLTKKAMISLSSMLITLYHREFLEKY
jgi:hypothetical protein